MSIEVILPDEPEKAEIDPGREPKGLAGPERDRRDQEPPFHVAADRYSDAASSSVGRDAVDPSDEIERRFVEQCLRDKGYKVIGWK